MESNTIKPEDQVSSSVTLSPVILKMEEGDVERIFATTSALDLRDIVIYVRGNRYENPWQRVILDTDIPLSYDDLAKQNIYVKGVNDTQAPTLNYVGDGVFCPVDVSAIEGDIVAAIEDKLTRYTTQYGIDNFEVLVYGQDSEAMGAAWEYFQDQVHFKQRVYFPLEFTNTLTLFKDGLDISVYAEKLKSAVRKNSLTSAYLHTVMEEVREQVRAGKVLIQDFENTRSLYAKWLTLCITQEFNLAPVYLYSYVSEYVALNIAYPVTKLSFYERLAFVKSLPNNVGYIPPNQEIPCVFTIYKKVYPHPELAFDIQSGDILTEGLEEIFNLETVQVLDYRSMFPESQQVFPAGQAANPFAGSMTTASRDEEVDRQLVDLFTKATIDAGKEGIYMSVRNTLFVKYAGRTYLLYFSEPFGLGGSLQSPYFGATSLVMEEASFNRLIDVKLVLADKARQDAASKQEGQQQFTSIMRIDTHFRPALDTYVLMCSEITSYISSGMSYYDRRLRCDKCVMPFVTHTDSTLSAATSVFEGSVSSDHIDLVNFRKDALVSHTVSAFGGINTQHTPGSIMKIPVTIETFRGCKLL